ncbi:MAG: DUF2062 domain-containing protein [Desulfitobacteriaceae bacterium]|nr:DUF2062 domain-containing protein [Desulfitobacteriaceae bacterium]MDD4752794.1 DUF2062 domain-containing protein [Desulfitobacteriaceae bacterium]
MNFWRWLRLKALRLMRLKGDPTLIAKGIAIGVSVDFLPTFGFGAVLAYLFARLLRVNRFATVITSLALTWMIIPFYGANIIVGRLFIKGIPSDASISDIGFFNLAAIKNLGSAFFLGSIINAVTAGVITYYLSLLLIKMHRVRKKNQMVGRRAVESPNND